MQRTQVWKREAGFTLVELMVVVAIISTMATIAVPNFMSYRNKSRVAVAAGTGEGIRAAVASFAADNANSFYPTVSMDYAAFQARLNQHGASLPANSRQVSISVLAYSSANGFGYTLVITTIVPVGTIGKTLTITPEGIIKQ